MTSNVSITLNAAQIKELASYAGFVFYGELEEDELETEYTLVYGKIAVKKDDDSVTEYAHVVHVTDYPEGGCYPLWP